MKNMFCHTFYTNTVEHLDSRAPSVRISTQSLIQTVTWKQARTKCDVKPRCQINYQNKVVNHPRIDADPVPDHFETILLLP